ncbi:MAG: hypothetical protein R3E32_21000 [Chitinophagales bacterium]
MKYQYLKQKIQNPCPQDWEQMDIVGTCGTVKFCQICQKNVTDVSAMDFKAIKQLATANEGEICIKVSQPSMYQHWSKILAKAATMGFIFWGLLGGQQVVAQNTKTDESYQITQVVTKSSTIIISGVVKGKNKIGWRKLEEANITLYSEEGLKIGEYITDEKGDFIIEVEKKLLGNKFGISFGKYRYEWTKIEEIETKNTNIAVFMDKRQGRYITGCPRF